MKNYRNGELMILVLPFSLLFVLMLVVPVVFGITISFTEWGIVGLPRFIGLGNYVRAFHDPYLLKAFINTFFYSLLIVPGIAGVALVMALFTNKGYPGSSVARALIFIPTVLSSSIISLVWMWLLDTQLGIINRVLGTQIPWLTNVHWSKVGVSMASIWWDTGISFVLFLAGLQEIPSTLYEASKIDGAGRWRTFASITFPCLRPTTVMVITLQTIATFRIFSQIYIMTKGGPASSSTSAVSYLYFEGIQRFEYTYANTISLLLFVVILLVTLAQRRLTKELAE